MINIAKPLIGSKERELVNQVLDSGMLAAGQKVKRLEEEFCRLCSTRHSIAVNSGTAALHSALYAIGVGPGDEVITTPFTFVATANPILMQGAKIVFADIDESTFNISPQKILEKVTDKTKAIITVDLFGQLCDYDEISKIAERNNLKIIEDACQAVGASYKDRKAGNFGNISCFSLYATKNIMCGEGGVITTNDDELAEKCRRFRHHGQSEATRYQYYDIGYNYRLSDLHASIAVAQVERLEGFTEKRQRNARRLHDGLFGIKGLVLPEEKIGSHVYHQFTIRVTKDFQLTRDELIAHLRTHDIGAAVFYPKPLHMHPHFERLGFKQGDFPVSEMVASQVLSLPVHPEVTEKDISKIVEAIKNA